MTDKKKYGLALLSKEDRKRIAALGGKSVRAESRPFYVNKDLAESAGRQRPIAHQDWQHQPQ
jgi:hypothetical protein